MNTKPLHQKGSEEEQLRQTARLAQLDGAELNYEVAKSVQRNHHFITIEDSKEILVYREGVWDRQGRTLIEQDAHRLFGPRSTQHRIREVLGNIRRETYVSRNRLGPQPWMVPVANGVLDVQRQQMVPHDPDHRSRWKLPVEFRPGAEAPRFRSFLAEITDSDAHRRVLQEYVGYCLWHWGVPYEKALMLVGEGANGKSTFLRVVNALLGQHNVSHVSLQDLGGNRFRPAELDGRLANIHPDLDSSALKHTGTFKALVSGDSITVEKKNQDPYSFPNRAKLIFSANEVPPTDDRTKAFHRRWLIVPFPYCFGGEERPADPHLARKLTEEDELSGVLNWAIKGLRRLRRNNGFSDPKSSREDLWNDHLHPAYRVLEERLEVDSSGGVPKQRVYDAVVEACAENGQPTPSKGDITRYIEGRWGVSPKQRRTGGDDKIRVYPGLAWS